MNFSRLLFVIIIVLLEGISVQYMTHAQNDVSCGDIVQGEISSNGEKQPYSITLGRGDRLDLYSQVVEQAYRELNIDISVVAPSGIVINDIRYDGLGGGGRSPYDIVYTGPLPDDGEHTITITGFTDTGGAYILYIGCEKSDGSTIGDNSFSKSIKCGDIVDGAIRDNQEQHRHYLWLEANSIIKASAEVQEIAYKEMQIDIAIISPSGLEIDGIRYDGLGGGGTSPVSIAETQELPETGVYYIDIVGFTRTGGQYILDVGCILPSGDTIEPGESMALSPNKEDIEEFSGFGFPGLNPVDFSDIARLPLPADIPMSGAVTPSGGEILGYQFDANEGDTVELLFNRLSGNLNLGLVVIDGDSNVIYQTSLVNSITMSAQFILPASGQYTTGVFRISLLPPDNPESTAFQISINLNP